jgi:single-strand DNA-binding protein
MLLGNLGADPELRTTQGGQSILKLRLATTETYLDRDKQRQERVEWHSISMWGARAEALAKFLEKGSKIFVEGSLRTTSYEKDGEKRYRTEINATNVLFAGGGQRDAGERQERPAAPRSPASREPVRVPRQAPQADVNYDDDIPF